MNPQEIRIGNWFHHKKVWSYRQDYNRTSEILEFDFQWDETDWYALGECKLSLDAIEPIQLTEEWLFRLGFVKNGSDFDFDDCALMSVRYDDGRISLFIGSFYARDAAMDYDFIALPNEVGYVHEIQNLFFALTGQELKPKS